MFSVGGAALYKPAFKLQNDELCGVSAKPDKWPSYLIGYGGYSFETIEDKTKSFLLFRFILYFSLSYDFESDLYDELADLFLVKVVRFRSRLILSCLVSWMLLWS